jgi:two-component system, NarL family, nitrate/nitrite response regulator NarL
MPVPILTPREVAVIQQIEQNKTNTEIANVLGLSIRTIETHRKNIYRKIRCHNSLALIKWAYENKIVTQQLSS